MNKTNELMQIGLRLSCIQGLQELFDHYTEVIAEKGTPGVDPVGGFAEDSSAYSAEKAAVDTVWIKYGKPWEAGLRLRMRTFFDSLRFS